MDVNLVTEREEKSSTGQMDDVTVLQSEMMETNLSDGEVKLDEVDIKVSEDLVKTEESLLSEELNDSSPEIMTSTTTASVDVQSSPDAEIQSTDDADSTVIPDAEIKSTDDAVSAVIPDAEIKSTDDATPTSEETTPATDENDDKMKDPTATEPPQDPRMMVIKNLDTGEEFVIGENDPDFEFNTFAIGGSPDDVSDETTGTTVGRNTRIPWWRSFFGGLGRNRNNGDRNTSSNPSGDDSAHGGYNNSSSKHPFTKLSSFKFRKELGRGAFGRVLLTEAKTDGTMYALKIITKKNMRSSDKRQAKAERDILYAITLKSPHPFTSGLKFAFQSENNLYLGMDYIPGGNLRQLIRRFVYLPEDWVRFYAAELILAISHLHSLNVLYRDIKPHNVMIDARGHMVLIDFGLSKQEISHPRGALSLVGTPDYSAPEVLRTGVQQIEAHNREKALHAGKAAPSRGQKRPSSTASNTKRDGTATTAADVRAGYSHIGYGKAADWWSLGIMIYEMIGGKPTFRGSDLRETYQRILYSKLEFVPEERFSRPARQLLEGLITRDPSARLGAWENPPTDIMNNPFFADINWDAIYERRQDGPWLCDLPSFMAKTRNGSLVSRPCLHLHGGAAPTSPSVSVSGGEDNATAASKAVDDATTSDWKPLVFSPVPLDRQVIETPKDSSKEKTDDKRKAPAAKGKKNSDVDSDSDDGEIAMRDSVFVSSSAGTQNRLLDWSFIDENVLMSSVMDQNEKTMNNDSKSLPSVAECVAEDEM